MHGVHLLGHPLHAGPKLLPHDHLLRGLLDEQPARLGGDVRLAECGLPDGRGGEEGLLARLLCDEPLHRLDHDDGSQPGLAALRGQVLILLLIPIITCMIVIRFLLGLGAGLEITISPVYIHETTKPELRDVCGSFPQVKTTQPNIFLKTR